MSKTNKQHTHKHTKTGQWRIYFIEKDIVHNLGKPWQELNVRLEAETLENEAYWLTLCGSWTFFYSLESFAQV